MDRKNIISFFVLLALVISTFGISEENNNNNENNENIEYQQHDSRLTWEIDDSITAALNWAEQLTSWLDDRQIVSKSLSDIQFGVLEQQLYNREMNQMRVFKKLVTDFLGRDHMNYDQFMNGVRVLGGHSIVHLQGLQVDTTDDTYPLAPRSTVATKTSTQAINAALAHCCALYDCSRRGETTASLALLPESKPRNPSYQGRSTLIWNIEIKLTKIKKMIYYINDDNLSIVRSFDAQRKSTGDSLYYGQLNFQSLPFNSTYYMEDSTRLNGVFECVDGSCYDKNRVNDGDNFFNAKEKAVNLAWGSSVVYDYYLNVHGRNGIDGSGGPSGYQKSADDSFWVFPHILLPTGTGVNEAYYNDDGIIYGDGDGVTYNPLVSLDNIGHEMTHGVIKHTLSGGFIYYGESGALEEAMCDIFGAMAERTQTGITANTWKHGEDYYTPAVSGDAQRYLDEPEKNGRPDHYTERYTGSSDNGGVHINAGIPSKAFYLLAMGGNHTNGGPVMTGLGCDEAEQIWYYALTSYMTPSTDFEGARLATVRAARDLFGINSQQYFQTGVSWGLCGVGTIPAPNGTELIDNSGFEISQLPWSMIGAYASYYIANGTQARTGRGYIYLGVNNAVTGAFNQLFYIPPTAHNATLTFYLRVTTQETTANFASDRLYVEFKNTLTSVTTPLVSFSNLNKGTTYVKRGPYPLIQYKNMPMMLQFRVVNDGNLPTTFYIDDVSISTLVY